MHPSSFSTTCMQTLVLTHYQHAEAEIEAERRTLKVFCTHSANVNTAGTNALPERFTP